MPCSRCSSKDDAGPVPGPALPAAICRIAAMVPALWVANCGKIASPASNKARAQARYEMSVWCLWVNTG